MSEIVRGKIALITGGASGIGLAYAKELLKNGLKGLTIADVAVEMGLTTVENLNKEFGPNKAIFIKTDVSNRAEFENTFKKTIETFNQLDIVINNAGIGDDTNIEKEIAVNINGVIYGSLLALEDYLPKYRSGIEGIIVKTGSVVGISAFAGMPIYTATKHAVIGLGISLGKQEHYEMTKVRVLTICPSCTSTILHEGVGNELSPRYTELRKMEFGDSPVQSTECVGKALIKVLNEGKSGSLWITEESKPAYEVRIPHWSQLRV